MSLFRVLVSDHATPDAFVGEIPFQRIAIAEFSNSPSRCTVVLSDLQSNAGLNVVAATGGSIRPGETLLWVERDGLLVFGGIVWGVSGSLPGDVVSIEAGGFHSYLRRRVVRATQTFASVDQWEIARSLIDYAEGLTDALGLIGTAQTETSGTTRDRTYPAWERKNIGEAIDQLAAVNGGFDFRYELTYTAGVPTVEFRCFDRTGFETDTVFAIDSNIAELSWSLNGSGLATQVDVFGEGDGPERLIASSTNSSPASPLLQAVWTHSDVSVPATLDAHADRYRREAEQARASLTARLNAGAPSGWATRVGDLVAVRADRGGVHGSSTICLCDDYKVLGRTIAVGGPQVENVALTLAPAAAFEEVV